MVHQIFPQSGRRLKMSKLHEDNQAACKMWYGNILSKLSEKSGCFRNPLDHAEKMHVEWKGLQLILISF